MTDKERVIKGIHQHCEGSLFDRCEECPYYEMDFEPWGESKFKCRDKLLSDVLTLLKEQEKKIKALSLLVEWAEECDFCFDQFPDEYERYRDEIKDMKYIEGMIHVAKRTLEDHGAFDAINELG